MPPCAKIVQAAFAVAVVNGHLEAVRLAHGARKDQRDTLWDGTPLGWATHCKREEAKAALGEP